MELITGKLSVWTRRTPSGRHMLCQFCPVCGSRIFHQMADQHDVISIKPGTLLDTKWLSPVGHIWSTRAQPWLDLDSDCLVYPENPENFEAIYAAWKARKSDNEMRIRATISQPNDC